ncbi:hypothetical protein SUGI_0737120 [Cryptomeria japonica]|nr:hypothetical protein SUGI_0737120 [Cryptomeria japonica]
MSNWHPPTEGWVKYNFDGCSKGSPRIYDAGGIIRDYKRRLMECYGKKLGVGTSNNAKALDAWRGLKILNEINYEKIIIEGDSKLIVYVLNGAAYSPWNIRQITEESKLNLGFFL